MVQRKKKKVFVFGHLGAIWAPANRLKKEDKSPLLGGMYSPMSKLKNKPLTKSLSPLSMEKWFKTTGKTVFLWWLFSLWGHFGTPKRT
jgi:hypothetical protein